MKPLIHGWILILSLAALAPAASAQSFDEWVSRANAARESKDWVRTIAYLKRAYEKQPLPALLNNIGRSYEELGWYRAATVAYEKVANDPAADRALRALDASRSSKLQPKLAKAFLKLQDGQGWSSVRVNGEPWEIRAFEQEIPVGPTRLEALRDAGALGWVLDVQGLLGRRLDVVLPSPPAASMGGVMFPPGVTLREIWVGPVKMESDVSKLRQLLLANGKTQLRLRVDGGSPLALSLDIRSGARLKLGEAIKAAIQVRDLRHTTSGDVGLPTGALVTTGLGVVGVAVGWVFASLAEDDRDTLRTTPRDGQGVIRSMTLTEARSLTADADSKAMTAGWLIGVGAGAVVTGLMWTLFEVQVPAPNVDSAAGRPGVVGVRF